MSQPGEYSPYWHSQERSGEVQVSSRVRKVPVGTVPGGDGRHHTNIAWIQLNRKQWYHTCKTHTYNIQAHQSGKSRTNRPVNRRSTSASISSSRRQTAANTSYKIAVDKRIPIRYMQCRDNVRTTGTRPTLRHGRQREITLWLSGVCGRLMEPSLLFRISMTNNM